MSLNAKIIIAVLVVALAGIYVWQFGIPGADDDQVRENGQENGLIQNGNNDLRPADSQRPAASVCVFQEEETVEFQINQDIPSPRCIRVLGNQVLAFKNNTNQTISFNFAGSDLIIESGSTAGIERPVGQYLAPGVHVIAMDFYDGSGPEVWVAKQSTVKVEGEIEQTFASARAFVLNAQNGRQYSIAISQETRIFNSSGAPVSTDNFSLLLTPGTRVETVVDLENLTTGTALRISTLP